MMFFQSASCGVKTLAEASTALLRVATVWKSLPNLACPQSVRRRPRSTLFAGLVCQHHKISVVLCKLCTKCRESISELLPGKDILNDRLWFGLNMGPPSARSCLYWNDFSENIAVSQVS